MIKEDRPEIKPINIQFSLYTCTILCSGCSKVCKKNGKKLGSCRNHFAKEKPFSAFSVLKLLALNCSAGRSKAGTEDDIGWIDFLFSPQMTNSGSGSHVAVTSNISGRYLSLCEKTTGCIVTERAVHLTLSAHTHIPSRSNRGSVV